MPPLRFDDNKSPAQAALAHHEAACRRYASWKDTSTQCIAALFDTPLRWLSRPTLKSILYSPCASCSPRSPQYAQVREWPPKMRHPQAAPRHTLWPQEAVHPEGGPLRYPMALASSHQIPSTGWASPHIEGRREDIREPPLVPRARHPQPRLADRAQLRRCFAIPRLPKPTENEQSHARHCHGMVPSRIMGRTGRHPDAALAPLATGTIDAGVWFIDNIAALMALVRGRRDNDALPSTRWPTSSMRAVRLAHLDALRTSGI